MLLPLDSRWHITFGVNYDSSIDSYLLNYFLTYMEIKRKKVMPSLSQPLRPLAVPRPLWPGSEKFTLKLAEEVDLRSRKSLLEDLPRDLPQPTY